MYSRSAKGGEKGDSNRNPWLAKMECMMHKYKKQRLGVYPYWSSSVFTMII